MMTAASLAQSPASSSLLEVEGVGKRFGGFIALDGINLSVAPGERVGLIGPNGSGKSTLVNCICGTLQQVATVTISSAVNLLIVGLLLTGFVIIAPNGILGLIHKFRGQSDADKVGRRVIRETP